MKKVILVAFVAFAVGFLTRAPFEQWSNNFKESKNKAWVALDTSTKDMDKLEKSGHYKMKVLYSFPRGNSQTIVLAVLPVNPSMSPENFLNQMGHDLPPNSQATAHVYVEGLRGDQIRNLDKYFHISLSTLSGSSVVETYISEKNATNLPASAMLIQISKLIG